MTDATANWLGLAMLAFLIGVLVGAEVRMAIHNAAFHGKDGK